MPYKDRSKQLAYFREYDKKRDQDDVRKQHRHYARVYRQRHSEKHLKARYGITLDQYRQMLVDCNFCCALCDGPPIGRWKALHIDHNHTTGKVRGLLCIGCNTALGSLNTPIKLMKAIRYLRRTDH